MAERPSRPTRATAPAPPVTVVAGAGLTGLAAAQALSAASVPTLVVERRARIGGLAAAYWHDGLLCHPGLHLLHPSTDDLVPTVREMVALMDGDVRVCRPDVGLHFLGQVRDFPFRTRELVRATGFVGMSRIVASALGARLGALVAPAPGPPETQSLEDVVRRAYGDEFYGLFFRDYTRKVLGSDPRRIAGEWARRRIPLPNERSGLRTVLQAVFPWWRPKRVEHPFPNFPVGQFTGAAGMEPLFDGLARRTTAEIRRETALAGIHLVRGRVAAVTLRTPAARAERLPVTALVATLPLTDTVGLFDPAPPPAVRAAARALRFRGIVFVYVEIFRPRLSPKHWTYFQSPEFVFNRLTEFGNVVPGAYGNDRTVVTAEITADPGEPAWELSDASCVAAVLAGIRRAHPDLRPAEIGRTAVAREPYAYPNYDLGFERHRRVVLDYADSISGFVTVGRQGRFDYLNMDECFAAGSAAARAVAT